MSKVILTFHQEFDITDTIESTLAEDGRTVADLSEEELLEMGQNEFEDHDFNKRAANFMTVHQEEPGRHYIVGGRIPHSEDVVAYVFVHEDDDRSAWEVFVETHLFDGIATPEFMERGENPLDYGTLPPDWRDRDPREDETMEGCWAYSNGEIEIPGPPVGDVEDFSHE